MQCRKTSPLFEIARVHHPAIKWDDLICRHYGSLKSPGCSCVSITLLSQRTQSRITGSCDRPHKNRYDRTESNFVAIVQLSVSNRNAINLCPVC